MDMNEDIGAAVQRAAKDLPDGYTIAIELERGAGCVTLFIPPVSDEEPGRTVDDFRGDCFADFLNNAISMAIEHAEEVGADSTAEPNCDRSQCGDFSPGPCDHPGCPAIRTVPDDMIAMENAQGNRFALKFNPEHQQHGWIFYDNHGQWVTLRRALPHEIERAKGILEMRQVLAGIPCKA